MKQSEIKWNKTYRGKDGKTTRKVIAFFGMFPGGIPKVRFNEYMVCHRTDPYRGVGMIRLSSFARWAKEEVEA